MPSIPNSEPPPAAAHSRNSDEEIEAEVDSDNSPPIQECILDKLNKTLHGEWVGLRNF